MFLPQSSHFSEPVDMFADAEDDRSTSTAGLSGSAPPRDEVTWEYRWDNSEEAELHGPFTSTQMQEWAETGWVEPSMARSNIALHVVSMYWSTEIAAIST